MPLSTHIDPDVLLDSIQRPVHQHAAYAQIPYSTRYSSSQPIPKYVLPDTGIPAAAAHQLLKDELDLDGRTNLNLASFVGTYMDKEADALIMENIAKNLADSDEYPAMMALHQRCISILAQLWGADVKSGETAIGTATTGSSEAIHLGGLAMKRRWQEKREAEGKSTLKPNILMGSNAQVALEKFARYFDVEARILPVSKESQFRLDPKLVKQNLDENTIGVFVILGSTYTGHYEPVQEVSDILDEYEKETGISIPIHVDGASGGFVAPFTDAGAGAKWNFELPRVVSINSSAHKFGLVYAGLGWVVWRSKEYLPEHLIFKLHYLGGTEETFTLNFSRPGAQVIAQYFNFLNLGREGYRGVMEGCMRNARILSKALEMTGWYECLSSIHRKKGTLFLANDDAAAQDIKKTFGDDDSSAAYNPGLPVVSFKLSDEFKKAYPHVRQDNVSLLLRAKGYIIPNYPLPPNEDKIEILRVVVRESMSIDLLDRLVSDIVSITTNLMNAEEIDLRSYTSTGPAIKEDPKAPKEKGPEEGGADHLKGMKGGIHRSVC